MESTSVLLEAIDGGTWDTSTSLLVNGISTQRKGRGSGGTARLPLVTTKADRLLALATAKYGLNQPGKLKQVPGIWQEVARRRRIRELLLSYHHVRAEKGDGRYDLVKKWTLSDESTRVLADMLKETTEHLLKVVARPNCMSFSDMGPLICEWAGISSMRKVQGYEDHLFTLNQAQVEQVFRKMTDDDIEHQILELPSVWSELQHEDLIPHLGMWKHYSGLAAELYLENNEAHWSMFVAAAVSIVDHMMFELGGLTRKSPHSYMAKQIKNAMRQLEMLDQEWNRHQGGGQVDGESDLFEPEVDPTDLPMWARGSTKPSTTKSGAERDLQDRFEDGKKLIEEGATDKYGYGHRNWCDMIISNKGDLHQHHEPKIPGLGPRPVDRGTVPRHMHRWTSDKKVFGVPRTSLGGSVLFDLSGSMSLNSSDLDTLMDILPAATMAGYSMGFSFDEGTYELPIWGEWEPQTINVGSKSYELGMLRVIAENGQRITDYELMAEPWASHIMKHEVVGPDGKPHYLEAGGGNGVDGPALEWLGQQKPFRIWVCDGHVTGLDDKQARNLFEDALKLMDKYRIIRCRNVEQAIETAKLIAKIGKAAWL